MASLTISSSFLLVLVFASAVVFAEAQNYPYPPLADGLSFDFYKEKCPDLELHIRDHLIKAFADDITIAPGVLHIQFQDCFGQGGCQSKVLLDEARVKNNVFLLFEELRSIVHSKCGRVVSCADIIILGSREAVVLSGGPNYAVPLGRKDSVPSETVEAVPILSAKQGKLHDDITTADTLLEQLGAKGLDAVDAVALLGAHTFGRSHCKEFTNRLYPTQDPLLESSYATNLKKICGSSNSANLSVLDVRTPNLFDNKYYVNLMKHQGLLAIDQDLYTDYRTKPIVTGFAHDLNLFFDSFVHAIVKLGQVNVLTGSEGIIRETCLATPSTIAMPTMSS